MTRDSSIPRFIVIALTLLPLTSGFPQSSEGAVQRDDVVESSIREFKDATRSNFERIRTWQGEATVTSWESTTRTKAEGRDRPENSAHVKFWRDLKNQQLRFDWDRLPGSTMPNDEEDAKVEDISGILTKERGIQYWRNLKRNVPYNGDDYYAVKATIETPQATYSNLGPFSQYFDPLQGLSNTGSRPAYELFEVYTHPEIRPSYVISYSDGQLKAETKLDSTTEIAIFDVSQGYNLVRYEAGDGTRIHSTVEIKYVKNAQGIWLPVEWSDSMWDLPADLIKIKPHRYRRVVFDHQEVNAPIDPSMFDLASLGLRPDDFVEDTFTGLIVPYGGPGAVHPKLHKISEVQKILAGSVPVGDIVATAPGVPPKLGTPTPAGLRSPEPGESSSHLVAYVLAITGAAAFGILYITLRRRKHPSL